MSLHLPEQRRNVEPRVRWRAAAFLIEAMLLLLFISISLVVLIPMYGQSIEKSTASADLSEAVALATNAAERFAAQPASVPECEERGALLVECRVRPEEREAGTLYRAQISVYKQDRPPAADTERALVYQMSTAAYLGKA